MRPLKHSLTSMLAVTFWVFAATNSFAEISKVTYKEGYQK